MEKKDFAAIRKKLGRTQKEIAILLGISLKAVCSYEQGWRTIPGHVERQLLFLVTRKRQKSGKNQNCWELKNCPDERRNRCPAWEFNSGKFCWFISGTICECAARESWEEKIQICKNCIVMREDGQQ